MRMKISLVPGPRQPLSRQTAWGCFTTNIALPGAGSLVAGRLSGYFQLALAITGLVLTGIFGVRFIAWYAAHWKYLRDPADPVEALTDLWHALRWPLLAMGIFLLGWLWALGTSLQILSAAKKDPPPNVPPQLRYS